MPTQSPSSTDSAITSLDAFAHRGDFSLVDTLNVDPGATVDGVDHGPRQVFSGHYVPVAQL